MSHDPTDGVPAASRRPRFVFEVRAEDTDGRVRGFGARRSRSEAADLLDDRVGAYEGSRG